MEMGRLSPAESAGIQLTFAACGTIGEPVYPHRIRLRGPWDCTPLDPELQPRRVTMPAGWVAAELTGYRGQACFTRRFGYPGRIDEGEHVWLLGEALRGCRSVMLNGRLLTDRAGASFAFDVTAFLAERNLLEIVLEGESDDVGLWGDIVLEIRRNAYLADLAVKRTMSGLIVTGTVIGTAPHALELYTLIDNRHADYRTVTPTASGTPFAIELSDVSRASESVRVELICVSSIWYAMESPIPP